MDNNETFPQKTDKNEKIQFQAETDFLNLDANPDPNLNLNSNQESHDQIDFLN